MGVGRLSIQGFMLLVFLAALISALGTRIGSEVLCYVTGPIVGASLSALSVPRDRSALVTGGLIGGLCQGMVSILLLKRGYPVGDVAMLTAPLFLASLCVHLLAGFAFGGLLFLALRWSRPGS